MKFYKYDTDSIGLNPSQLEELGRDGSLADYLAEKLQASPSVEEIVSNNTVDPYGGSKSPCYYAITSIPFEYGVNSDAGEVLVYWDVSSFKKTLPEGYTLFSFRVMLSSASGVKLNSEYATDARALKPEDFPVRLNITGDISTPCGITTVDRVVTVPMVIKEYMSTFNSSSGNSVNDYTETEFKEALVERIDSLEGVLTRFRHFQSEGLTLDLLGVVRTLMVRVDDLESKLKEIDAAGTSE